MTETDPEAVVEPVTAGKVGARRAEIGQQLPESVTGSLNVPQVRPAAAARPEAATPCTADPTPAMLNWPPIEPPRRPDITDDLAERARLIDEAPPVNDVIASHARPADTAPAVPRPVTEAPSRNPGHHPSRYVTAAAVAAAAVAALRGLVRHRRKAHH